LQENGSDEPHGECDFVVFSQLVKERTLDLERWRDVCSGDSSMHGEVSDAGMIPNLALFEKVSKEVKMGIPKREKIYKK
tara:strand:+ start:215 stop:451 length:237 start_codon:yes stop_codon:yes gene_type:complete